MADPGFDPKSVVVDALAIAVRELQDRDLASLWQSSIRPVADIYRDSVKPGDVGVLALPTMVVVEGRRFECGLLVLQDRLVFAWQSGMIRRVTQSAVVPRTDITEVRAAAGAGVLRSAMVLTVTAGKAWEFVLPTQDAALANRVAEIIRS